MKSLSGRNAVVTGAASGIGLALARLLLAEGMQVAIVDLPGDKLNDVEKELQQSAGENVKAFGSDVSDVAALQKTSDDVQAHFGIVYLLFNNAGVNAVHRRFWNYAHTDWQQLLSVNLQGVINGVQVFLPRMMGQGEGHIVNTSSAAGMVPSLMNAPYCTSKYAVVGLSETLALDLETANSPIGISVVCPGGVQSGFSSTRTPETLAKLDEAEKQVNLQVQEYLEASMAPETAALIILNAVKNNDFYIFTHAEILAPIEFRMKAILNGGRPTVVIPKEVSS